MRHRAISPKELRLLIRGTKEHALLDVREAQPFVAGHLLTASNAPLSRLEIVVPRLAPRKTTTVVLCDAEEQLALEGAERLAELGYTDLRVLEDGTSAWSDQGYVLFEGSNVPSKAFGEIVGLVCHTPALDAAEVKRRVDSGDNLIVLDGRPWDEYRNFNIPGGIDCPNAELVYRVKDLVPNPETTIVVNCAGRTRSIIGAQTLVNAGVPNPVYALRNGTIGWEWAGLPLEHGADRRHAPVSEAALRWSQAQCEALAQRAGVDVIDLQTLDAWGSQALDKTLYVFDVREPEEFAQGSLPGAVSAQGTQLVQATDEYLAVRAGRIVLVDDTGVRARMTASWLKQLGYQTVAVLDADMRDHATATQAEPRHGAKSISPAQAAQSQVFLLDLSLSLRFMEGHPEGARWGLRSRMDDILAHLCTDQPMAVLDDEQEYLAALAVRELSDLGYDAGVLEGGLAAWRAAGLPVAEGPEGMLSPMIDPPDMPFDLTGDPDAAKSAYIDWELQLPEQIEKDGLLTFTPLNVL